MMLMSFNPPIVAEAASLGIAFSLSAQKNLSTVIFYSAGQKWAKVGKREKSQYES